MYNNIMKNMSVKKRKTINRSGKARCDICEKRSFLERHHVNGRNVCQPDHPSNIANICPTCHTEVHYGKVIIEGWVQTTAGKELMWHLKDEESFTGSDASPHQF